MFILWISGRGCRLLSRITLPTAPPVPFWRSICRLLGPASQIGDGKHSVIHYVTDSYAWGIVQCCSLPQWPGSLWFYWWQWKRNCMQLNVVNDSKGLPSSLTTILWISSRTFFIITSPLNLYIYDCFSKSFSNYFL
jgi:hypothetical protein